MLRGCVQSLPSSLLEETLKARKKCESQQDWNPDPLDFLSTKTKRLKSKTISGHRRGGEPHVDRVSLPAAPSNLDDLRRGRHPRPQGQDRQVLQGPVGRAQQAQPGQHPHREVAV